MRKQRKGRLFLDNNNNLYIDMLIINTNERAKYCKRMAEEDLECSQKPE